MPPISSTLARSRSELADFDFPAYEQARQRVETQAWLSAKTAELSAVTKQAAAEADAVERALGSASLDARHTHKDAAPAREHIRTSEQLTAELQCLELERDRVAAAVLGLDGERSQLTEALSQATGWRERQKRKGLGGQLADLKHHRLHRRHSQAR